MARFVRKNERGLTLIETVVALAIIFIVFLGLTDAGLLVMESNIGNTIRDEGVSVAEKVMAEVRQTPFATLKAAPDNVAVALPDETRQIRGMTVTYRPARTVTRLNEENLQVMVEVDWTRRGKDYSHQATTLVRNR